MILHTLKVSASVTSQNFKRFLAIALACIFLGLLGLACGSKQEQSLGYPIDPNVTTTVQRMLAFPITMGSTTTNLLPTPPPNPNGGPGLAATELCKVSEYDELGYGAWKFGAGLPSEQRQDLMPLPHANPAPVKNTKLLSFFTISDIHITDEQAPNQLIYLQQLDGKNSGNNTSIYSPVMMYTTQVLDAAIQTINALNKQNQFDFGISLGDTCNNTSFNELRWYIDVIDGEFITPSSGNRGANLDGHYTDYQRPFQAAGLDKSIPWYQAIGNHDHFYIGSFPVDADPSLGLREAYISNTIWSVSDLLNPEINNFPVLFNKEKLHDTPLYYMGVFDSSTPYGTIIKSGPVDSDEFNGMAPMVDSDPDRRSLTRTQWLREFFNTSSSPLGHGFNLVDPNQPAGFACYSFLPKSDIPLKVIVLDDTQSETDGSNDIHGHGYLDANRWAWLQAELDAGQAANQLMIIAAHVPIAVSAIGSETEWWLNEATTAPENLNAVDLDGLINKLRSTPNLLMWISGHRHLNVVKAFPSDDSNRPERGFWQVETSSLRDYPQQFRTFEIYLNSDYTISIVTTDVDPAVAEGTPAATSRKYAIAVQQIIQADLTENTPNVLMAYGAFPVPSMDPTRRQGTPTVNDPLTDPSIHFPSLSGVGVPYNASYNAELFKKLSPEMTAVLQAQFPAP